MAPRANKKAQQEEQAQMVIDDTQPIVVSDSEPAPQPEEKKAKKPKEKKAKKPKASDSDAEELQKEEPLIKADEQPVADDSVKESENEKAKKPRAKKDKATEETQSDASDDSVNTATSKGTKKIDGIIKLLKDGKVDEGIAALEKMKDSGIIKKERKPRAPTMFNLYVKERMSQFANVPNMNDRMKRISELWATEKATYVPAAPAATA